MPLRLATALLMLSHTSSLSLVNTVCMIGLMREGNKKQDRAGYSAVEGCLPTMHEALGSIPKQRVSYLIGTQEMVAQKKQGPDPPSWSPLLHFFLAL